MSDRRLGISNTVLLIAHAQNNSAQNILVFENKISK